MGDSDRMDRHRQDAEGRGIPSALDLAVLGIHEDPAHRDELVRRIMAGAEPELRRRRQIAGPLGGLAYWARPILAAAAVVMLLAGGALRYLPAGAPDPILGELEEAETFPELLGLPSTVATWVSLERDPTAQDLIMAWEYDETW